MTELKKDILNKEEILAHLQNKNLSLQIFDEIDSTNTYAKQLLREGASAPFCLIADKQTAGRGRRGNSFFSPSSGLYYTLVVQPKAEELELAIAHTTIAAAVSVQQAIQECAGIETAIKWVNDLYLDTRKVCGILCEAPRGTDGEVQAIVIGIGINCVEQNFPEELKDKAGALNSPTLVRNELAAALSDHLLYWTSHLKDPQLIEAYRKHSFLLGRNVSFTRNGIDYTGTAKDINDDGNLLVETSDGMITLSSGEVSLTSWSR